MISLPPEKSKKSRSSTGGGITTSSTSLGTHCSSSSKRWSREIANARTTTSSGERIGRSRDRVRDVEHEDAVDAAGERVRDRDEVHDRAVDERVAVVRRPAGRSRAARRCRARPGGSGSVPKTTSSPVRRSAATTRSGIRSSAKRVRQLGALDDVASPSLRIRWSSRRSTFHARRMAFAGEHLVARESEPHLLEVVELLERGRGGERRPVECAGRGPDDDVGPDASLQQARGASRPGRCPGCRRPRARTPSPARGVGWPGASGPRILPASEDHGRASGTALATRRSRSSGRFVGSAAAVHSCGRCPTGGRAEDRA